MSLSLAPTFSYHSRGETITSFRPLSVPTPWPVVVEITSEQLGLAVGVSCYLLWEQSKTGWAWSEDMRGASDRTWPGVVPARLVLLHRPESA